jgi:tripartite-type tricarboxylate transporter receptor subunit TctC
MTRHSSQGRQAVLAGPSPQQEAPTDSQQATSRPALGRRRLLGATVALPLAAATAPTLGQSRWPDRPIKLVVPYPPGGNSDILGRTVADRLRALLNATVTVENKPGGTTQLGTEQVARSAPDGYTMLLGAATAFTMLPHLRTIPFSLEASFEVAGGVAEYVAIVTARKSLGLQTMDELVALARRNPGKLTWGSAGQASAGHLYGEMIKRHYGIDLLHVPFKGSADAATAMLGDQIDLIIDGVGLRFAREQRAVALATFFDQRHPDLSEIPAITEVARGLVLPAGGWGLMMPKGTPRPIIDATSQALKSALAEPETRDRLLRASIIARYAAPADYVDLLQKSQVIYRDLLRAVGMTQSAG